MHFSNAMSRREHLGLRGFAVVLLAVAALWPRSRATHSDREVARHAIRGQYATAAARPSAEDPPRPRSERLFSAAAESDVDESQLRD